MEQTRRYCVKEQNISVRDYVLVKQTKSNEWSTPFEPRIYVVVRVVKKLCDM